MWLPASRVLVLKGPVLEQQVLPPQLERVLA